MKQNRLGNWTKGTRLTVRLTESVRDAIADAAIENRRSMADTVTGVLTQWCVAREVGRQQEKAE
jgi:hypothetical protein